MERVPLAVLPVAIEAQGAVPARAVPVQKIKAAVRRIEKRRVADMRFGLPGHGPFASESDLGGATADAVMKRVIMVIVTKMNPTIGRDADYHTVVGIPNSAANRKPMGRPRLAFQITLPHDNETGGVIVGDILPSPEAGQGIDAENAGIDARGGIGQTRIRPGHFQTGLHGGIISDGIRSTLNVCRLYLY